MIDKPEVAKPKLPSYRDLILRNCLRSVQYYYAAKTSLLDFHKLVVTVKKINHKDSYLSELQITN